MKYTLRALPFLLLILFSGCDGCRKVQVMEMQPDIQNGGRALAITQNPDADRMVVVASEGAGLFKSEHHGSSWRQVSGTGSFYFSDVAWYPANTNVVIATSYRDTRTLNRGGIWRSQDKGNSWTHIPVAPPVTDTAFQAYCISFEPGAPSRIWVGTSKGLAYSDDEGVNWSFNPSASNFPYTHIFSILTPVSGQIKVVTRDGFRASTDRGSSWVAPVSSGNPPVPTRAQNQLACSPLDHRLLFWAAYDSDANVRLYWSENNGSVWNSAAVKPGTREANRPPFVRVAPRANTYDVYFGNGLGEVPLQRNQFPFGNISRWRELEVDHADCSDMSFNADGTPALLTSDGGIHKTTDKGVSWKLVGGGIHGYNALQISEAAGQLRGQGEQSYLYFGTQDNSFWASSNSGETWPEETLNEGYHLNVPRQALPSSSSRFTAKFVTTREGESGNFITGPLFTELTGFPDAYEATSTVKLLSPGRYFQVNVHPEELAINELYVTTNTGASWIHKNTLLDDPSPPDRMRVVGANSAPVIFATWRSDEPPVLGRVPYTLMKIMGALNPGIAITSKLSGVASVASAHGWSPSSGTLVRNMAYAVNPHNPNHIIVVDSWEGQIQSTYDGGVSWFALQDLKTLVTNSGEFKFRLDGQQTQITDISFNPDKFGHILVGTAQAGVFFTCNNGADWTLVEGSEKIPNVSSFYFEPSGWIVVSSYGRGLWKIKPDCPRSTIPPLLYREAPHGDKPIFYYDGVMSSLKDVIITEAQSHCTFYLMKEGSITNYAISSRDSNTIAEVGIDGGTISASVVSSKSSVLPFNVVVKKEQDAKDDTVLAGLLAQGYRIKGLYLEGQMLKGLVLSPQDVTSDRLPTPTRLLQYLRADYIRRDSISVLRVLGRGFDARLPVVFTVNGDTLESVQPQFDARGDFKIRIPFHRTAGEYTLVAGQQAEEKEVVEAAIFEIFYDDQE